MAPTITNQNHTLIENQEVSFGTITSATGFDFVDALIDGTANSDVIAEWRLYETVGGLSTLVATAPGGGEQASVLDWQVGGASVPGMGPAPYSPAKGSGFTFELRAFLSPDQAIIPNPAFRASLVGYDEFDVAANADTGLVTVQVPLGGEVQITTLGGYAQSLDVSVAEGIPVPVRFTLYAQAGVAGVTAEVASTTVQGGTGAGRILSPARLPGALTYILRCSFDTTLLQSIPAVPVFVSAGMTTHSQNIAVGGVVALAGNANGPSNANAVTDFGFLSTNANVVAAQFEPITAGRWYVGMTGLTAPRTVILPDNMPSGSRVTIKDEDGSLATQTITVSGSTGKTIDGGATFVMNAASPGPKGSNTFIMNFDATPEWSVV